MSARKLRRSCLWFCFIGVLLLGPAAFPVAGIDSGPRFSGAYESAPSFVAQGVASDCCVTRLDPGCDDPDCEAAICAVDPFCCQDAWDIECVVQAEETCLVCGAPFCGDGEVNDETEQCEPPNTATCDMNCQAIFDCPLSNCIDGDCELTQSLDTSSIQGDSIACNQDPFTTPQGWARCYDISAEGLPEADLVIEEVTFGAHLVVGDGINLDVVLYEDTNGCPPTGKAPDEFARAPVVVNAADQGMLITVAFPSPAPVLPAGSDLVVEIEQLEDGIASEFAFYPMANQAGECGPSYLRADACGQSTWGEVATLPPDGFPNVHLVQIVNPHPMPTSTPMSPTPTPTPTPMSTAPGTPTATATPTGTPSSTPSMTPTATPTATPTVTPTPPPISCGDVDGSGAVNIGDALVVAQFEAGLVGCGIAPLSDPENCDVAPSPSGDGSCNIGDALLIAQCDAGLVLCDFGCMPFGCP